MKISARNTLVGKIVEIHEGPVSTEVTIETAAGEKIVSSITTTSAKNLGLKVGGKAYAKACGAAEGFEADKVPKDALPFGTLSFGSSANV